MLSDRVSHVVGLFKASYVPEPFSEGAPRTSSINVTWELLEMHSLRPPRLTESKYAL